MGEEDRRQQHFGFYRQFEGKQASNSRGCQEALRDRRLQSQHVDPPRWREEGLRPVGSRLRRSRCRQQNRNHINNFSFFVGSLCLTFMDSLVTWLEIPFYPKIPTLDASLR